MAPTDDGVNPVRWAISRYVFRNGASSRPSPQDEATGPSKWSMGILNDRETVEVPGSVLLLARDRNEPLGLRNIHARTSHSSIPTGFPVEPPPAPPAKKKTEDGTIILDPQPDDSVNDPLNWPSWRRDAALLSLGFYCMIGGGITPLIAAGFTDVAHDFDISVERVALTTGLCMTGLGIGSVIASPTTILYGKRPIYLTGAILFIATSLWAGFSPSFESLLAARVFQGISISPVECLPSATIAEIFFLHERAYRIGIYALLLLGGKNLIPLVSAAIIGRFGWRWAFYIVSMVVGLGFVLLFLFVPETFWDRTPTRRPTRKPSLLRRLSSRHTEQSQQPAVPVIDARGSGEISLLPNEAEPNKNSYDDIPASARPKQELGEHSDAIRQTRGDSEIAQEKSNIERNPSHVGFAESQDEKDSQSPGTGGDSANSQPLFTPNHDPATSTDPEKNPAPVSGNSNAYTHDLRQRPAQSFTQYLKPFHGRLNHDNWFKFMLRPFILLAYPAVL
ncbi:hypothetical protein FALBO_16863 [Fusarium albosuccineum]|uniref:Major facilitator superfamily (MFS) profile domain-containing protein n=1 Tax=Fusarium albosuccineum TaxID=1237068 RepID=A0A8H4NR58_9HYPO|nr:hypothetical protein FALBO_16863 [Fusarium albosuccineum]